MPVRRGKIAFHHRGGIALAKATAFLLAGVVPAGAVIEPATLSRARHLNAQMFLDNNDATSFFEAAGGLIVRGPTHTNVNDFRVILVDP